MGWRAVLCIMPFTHKLLSFQDRAQCQLWTVRLARYRLIVGPQLFVGESLRVAILFCTLRDPLLYINWMRRVLTRLNF